VRKRLWIDVSLQLRVVFFILILLSATLALAFLSVSRGLKSETLQPMLFPFLVGSAIALTGGALVAFVWAHRLIGPLMVLTAALKRISQGDLRNGLILRDTDLQWDTTREFERLRHSLRERIHDDRERLTKVESRLDALSSRIKSTPAVKELRAIQHELSKITSTFQL